jgi:hypothetical protein
MNLRPLFAAALALLLAGCSSTPVPQPPPGDLDLAKVVVPDEQPATTGGLIIQGEPGAAPPGSVLRITNLDSADPPWSVPIDDDGSFSATIAADFVDELRFQIRIGEERLPPKDVVIAGGGFAEVPRIGCFPIDKELDLGTGPVGTELSNALTLQHGCSTDAAFELVFLRTNDPAFGIDVPPTTLAPDVALDYGVTLTPEAGEQEEILFLNITAEGQSARYPVTLFGTGQ